MFRICFKNVRIVVRLPTTTTIYIYLATSYSLSLFVAYT